MAHPRIRFYLPKIDVTEDVTRPYVLDLNHRFRYTSGKLGCDCPAPRPIRMSQMIDYKAFGPSRFARARAA
jgi:hypothetical protein